MQNKLSIFLLSILVWSCSPSEKNIALIEVYDYSSNYAPSLGVGVDGNEVRVQLKMAGNTLLDSIHEFSDQRKSEVLETLKSNNVRLYSPESPDWKEMKSKEMTPEEWVQIENVFLPELNYALEYYHTLLKAANSLNKLSNPILEKSDTFAAD